MIGHRNSKLNQIDNFTKNAVILSAYFCGTEVKVKDEHLTGILSHFDQGCELKLTNEKHDPSQLYDQYKMSFDGNAVEYGLPGFIFGTGIDEQCQKVVSEVKRILELIKVSNEKKRIIVNVFGVSRGGITAFLLAKMLGNYPMYLVEVNLAVLDPVPGNLIVSANFDIFNQTLAKQVMYLDDCHNLNRVISLYSYQLFQPYPPFEFFAPLKPLYPAHTLVEDDIVFGAHDQAGNIQHASYAYAAPRFIKFMSECGTKYHEKIFAEKLNPSLDKSAYDLLLSPVEDDSSDDIEHETAKEHEKRKLNRSKQYLLPKNGKVIIRDFHTATGWDSQIVMKRPENENEYINLHHRFLVTGEIVAKSRAEIPTFNPDHETVNSLKSLAKDVYDGISDKNRSSRKGRFLFSLMNKLDDVILDKNDITDVITHYLKLLINITLQFDGNGFCLFSSTTSADKLKELLKLEEYIYFANLVKGATDHALDYKDLLSFAGGYDEEYFHTKNREVNYEKIEITLNRM